MGACEQLCLPRPQGLFTCACATGFKLNTDNRTCAPYQSYVVISTLSAIKGFSLEGADHSEAMVPVAGIGQLFSYISHYCCMDAQLELAVRVAKLPLETILRTWQQIFGLWFSSVASISIILKIGTEN